jgi:hypothetical protein
LLPATRLPEAELMMAGFSVMGYPPHN